MVTGILAADNNLWLMLALIVAGALVLVWFFASVRGKERAGKEPLLSMSLFRNRISNLGLVTQGSQWLILMGVSFVVSAYLQVVRRYDAIQTGVIFTAATVGLLASSLAAARLAKRYPQRTLILAGFIVTIAGVGVLLALVIGIKTPSAWVFAPGLLLIGLGLGAMLTPSVNIVQSSFAEEQQGEISGLSRSVSNLGSCLGTAIAGTILVAGITATPERSYGLAMIALAVVGLIGLVAAIFLPAVLAPPAAERPPQQNPPQRGDNAVGQLDVECGQESVQVGDHDDLPRVRRVNTPILDTVRASGTHQRGVSRARTRGLSWAATGKLPREAPGCCKCAAPARARRAGSQLQLPAAPGCSAAAAPGGAHLLLEDPGAATVV